MKYKHKLLVGLAISISIILSYVCGYMFGFKDGFYNFSWFDAAGKSAVSVMELRSLRKGDISNVIKQKEYHLNDQILLHGDYLERGNHFMTSIFFRFFYDAYWSTAETDYRSLMFQVSKYRNEYPIKYEIPEFTSQADDSYKEIIEENLVKNNRKLKEILDIYKVE